MAELKPCPFCGKDAFVWRTNHYTYVQCEDYHCQMHCVQIGAKTDKEAFDLWNTRTQKGGEGK